jgi:hypothetical protein
MPPKKTPTHEVSEIIEVTRGQFECCILGTSPLILNRMSEKAKRELLMPKGRKNAIDKATSLKHNPVEEYRASAYRMPETQPTLLGILSTAFKRAMGTAALDMPGAKKAQIGRLTYIEGDYVGIFGVPQLFMSIVRSADMNKTPDVRTRAIVPHWACRVRVTYVEPLIRPQAVANLLAAAGLTVGVGDWRPEKGAGSYGQFQIVGGDHAGFLDLLKTGGRGDQADALETPVCYDEETADLLAWYDDERAKRNLRGVA